MCVALFGVVLIGDVLVDVCGLLYCCVGSFLCVLCWFGFGFVFLCGLFGLVWFVFDLICLVYCVCLCDCVDCGVLLCCGVVCVLCVGLL